MQKVIKVNLVVLSIFFKIFLACSLSFLLVTAQN